MDTFVVPDRIWVNLAVLVAAGLYVAIRIAATRKAGRKKHRSKPVSASLNRATK